MAASSSDYSIGPGADVDPAQLAFLKCHITSPLKWEVLRLMAAREGCWVHVDDIAHGTQRGAAEVEHAIAELAHEDVVQAAPDGAPTYRLSATDPTSVVLRRLIENATHSHELRGIIAAHLLRAGHQDNRAA